MLKILLKKQIMEVFKGYFYNPKKNKKRSKAGVIGYFLLFFAIMAGLLGGMFAALSSSLIEGFYPVGMGWLYFAIMSGLSVLMGAFGSVFNSYSALYLSKDNDLLLSMPIPVGDIIASRLLNVYLLGLMYSAVVIIPALIVYWVKAACTVATVLCGILLMLMISLLVLILSCLLGWVVAKISLKLKNRSYVRVLASLAFIGLYYFFYFRANTLVQDMITNASAYGEKIKGSARAVYLFGQIGEGNLAAAGIGLCTCALLTVLTWLILKKTFLSIAVSEGDAPKKNRAALTQKQEKQRTVFGAMLQKELARFTASSTYMLNCGLGILLLPVSGVLILIKSGSFVPVLEAIFGGTDYVCILLTALVCLMVCMNDMATPSVSLEGKSIWIYQSLPVEPGKVLRAKIVMQLLLGGIPSLFALLCVVIAVPGTAAERLLMVVVAALFILFNALFCSFLGLKMANLTWTNEVIPIKQSGAVAISIFGCWGVAIAFGGLYFLVGSAIGYTVYALLWAAVLAAASLILWRWTETKGGRIFAEM